MSARQNDSSSGSIWAVLAALSFVGCDAGSTAPEVGAIDVSVITQGLDPDDNGFGVSLNDGYIKSVSTPTGTAAFNGLRAGEYLIALSSIAPNCTADADRKTVIVRPLETTAISFRVDCVATKANLRVSAATTGIPDPDGYLIEVNGDALHSFWMPANGASQIRYPFGPAEIKVTEVAHHCTVEGGTTRKAIFGQETDVAIAFQVSCRDAVTTVVGRSAGVVSSSDAYCDTDSMSDAPDPCVRYLVTIPARGTLVVRVTWDGDRWMVLRLGTDERRYYASDGIVGTLLVDEGDTVRFSVGMHGWKAGDSQPFSIELDLIQ